MWGKPGPEGESASARQNKTKLRSLGLQLSGGAEVKMDGVQGFLDAQVPTVLLAGRPRVGAVGAEGRLFLRKLSLPLGALPPSAPRWRRHRCPPGRCPALAAAPRATSPPSPPPAGAAWSAPAWGAQVTGCGEKRERGEAAQPSQSLMSRAGGFGKGYPVPELP